MQRILRLRRAADTQLARFSGLTVHNGDASIANGEQTW